MLCVFRCWSERAPGAQDSGCVQPHGGLRAAARREDHQPVLLGLAHGRAPEPAVPGPQQHRALHRALPHQPRLHDLQRRLPGPLLVQEIHHGLRALCRQGLPSSCPREPCWAALDSVRAGRKMANIETFRPTLIFFISVRGLIFCKSSLIVRKGGGGE